MGRIYRWLAIASLVIFTPLGLSTLAASPSITVQTKVMNISHRGASGHAPEHTFPSYEIGNLMNGDYIEVDLQMTKDGELIALHDETMDRTTGKKGYAKDFTLEEIKRLDAGSWFNEAFPEKANPAYKGLQVPTLREILDRFGPDSNFFIETKSPDVYPGMEEKLLSTLKEYELEGNIIIQSFSVESLRKIHDLDQSIPLIQLLSYYAPASISDSEVHKIREYAIGVGLHFTAVNPAYIKKITDSGLLIVPYTVNEKEDMEMLIDWGVNGMFTNYPDRLNEVIRARVEKRKNP
ncbi:glycerophosphodiester phosphodiesterase [Mesobacillus jeotgali]|uniref:glycerophosphodiester phosphodiesterase n=1 Tax=Mesobacillus jeotgali TaxID=129985 RepID=UPI0009A7BD2C|nr:glycerophosphodiester phosphodiesterase [Mesobacillus jeotgali]